MHLSKDFSVYLKQIEHTFLMIDQQTSFFPENFISFQMLFVFNCIQWKFWYEYDLSSS